jgi:hypothetical protein
MVQYGNSTIPIYTLPDAATKVALAPFRAAEKDSQRIVCPSTRIVNVDEFASEVTNCLSVDDDDDD